MSFNKVILLGNVGKDPTVNSNGNGKIGSISVATTRRYKANGERQEETEWHYVTVFGPQAEFTEKYVRKGSQILVEGRLRTRKWEANDGSTKYRTEIVCENISFVGGTNKSANSQDGRAEYKRQSSYDKSQQHRPMPVNNGITDQFGNRMDEDIPF